LNIFKTKKIKQVTSNLQKLFIAARPLHEINESEKQPQLLKVIEMFVCLRSHDRVATVAIRKI